ncbi:MAG TPA: hypothetical protein VFH27_11900 [Longimicrobiaceae bacterium]|nr:hypothetical protein [Longimicrobiaceae bacterium]
MRHLLAAAVLAAACAACTRTPTAPVAGQLPAVVVSRAPAAPSAAAPVENPAR